MNGQFLFPFPCFHFIVLMELYNFLLGIRERLPMVIPCFQKLLLIEILLRNVFPMEIGGVSVSVVINFNALIYVKILCCWLNY